MILTVLGFSAGEAISKPDLMQDCQFATRAWRLRKVCISYFFTFLETHFDPQDPGVKSGASSSLKDGIYGLARWEGQTFSHGV